MRQDSAALIHQYDVHALTRNVHTFREAHIESDWLLLYQIEHNTLTPVLVETGNHKQLLGRQSVYCRPCLRLKRSATLRLISQATNL